MPLEGHEIPLTNEVIRLAKERGEIGKRYVRTIDYPTPSAQCRGWSRHRHQRCTKWGIVGTTKALELEDGTILVGGLCTFHGGRLTNVQAHAEQVVEAARIQLLGLSEQAVDALDELSAGAESEQVRLNAANSILDRNNVRGALEVQVEHVQGESVAERTRRRLAETAKRLTPLEETEVTPSEENPEEVTDAEIVD